MNSLHPFSIERGRIDVRRLSGPSTPCSYFTIRLFFTDLTPLTPRETSPALLTLRAESTKPLNWTSPLNLSTLIWNTFKDGSFMIAAFTFAVIAESSTYSPVPSRVGVEAHPRYATTNVMQTRKLNVRCLFVMALSPFCLEFRTC